MNPQTVRETTRAMIDLVGYTALTEHHGDAPARLSLKGRHDDRPFPLQVRLT